MSWSSEEILVSVDAGEKPANICSDGGRIFVGTTEVCDIDLGRLVREKTVVCGENNLPDYVISPCYEYDDTEEESEITSFNCADHPNSAEDEIPLIELSESGICSKNCGGQCGQVYRSFTENEKLRMQTMFKSEKSLDTKRKLLAHLQCQLDCGLNTDGYHLINHTFCCTFLEYQINISKFILNSVLNDFWKGYKFYDHGNAGVMKTKASTSMFIAWLKQFSESYGQYAPDSNITVLSYWLNKKVLYDMYIDETVGPHLKPSTFYESFKTFFGPNRQDKSLPQVRISKYSSHSICNICTALNTNKRQSQSEAELKIAQDKINHHKLIFGDARRKVDEIIQSALSFPADNLGKPFKINLFFFDLLKILFRFLCIIDLMSRFYFYEAAMPLPPL